MHGTQVVAFVEVVLNHLPVARHGDRIGQIAAHFGDRIHRPVVPHRAQVCPERRRLRIHVHPDKTGETFAFHFTQRHLAARIALRKIFRVLGEVQAAVRQVGPAVVLADEALGRTLLIEHEPVTAVLTDVVERLDAAVLLPDHENRFRPHFLALPVAGLRHFLLTTEQQPDLRPHVLELAFEELAARVALAGNGMAADDLPGPRLGRFRTPVFGTGRHGMLQ